LAESLTELLESAALHGVKLYLEPLNRYEIDTLNRVDQSLEFMAQYGLNSLELLLDTFHMNIEERRLEQAISLAGAKIGHIHITDSNRLAPGQGHLDYDRIIAAIKQTGYDKFLSIEALPLPSSVACALQKIEFFKGKNNTVKRGDDNYGRKRLYEDAPVTPSTTFKTD
jgi:sugar phosphate isomerase/epimerase